MCEFFLLLLFSHQKTMLKKDNTVNWRLRLKWFWLHYYTQKSEKTVVVQTKNRKILFIVENGGRTQSLDSKTSKYLDFFVFIQVFVLN